MSAIIKVKGVATAYRFDGPNADVKGARVVLLSNSLMSDTSMWDRTVPALADRYRVLRYDSRGHGRTGTTPGPYSIGQLTDDVVGLLDALEIGRVHFVGLSMGGMIGQQLGARFPHRVHSMALCDTASEMPPRSLWEERIAIARSQGMQGLADATIKRWFTVPFISRDPDAIAKVKKMILDTGAEGYIACASAVRDMAQSVMLLKVKAPTLIMVGRDDPACTVDQSMVLHRLIEGSEMLVIEKAAHLSNIEQPDAFNGALRAFIDRVDDRLPKIR